MKKFVLMLGCGIAIFTACSSKKANAKYETATDSISVRPSMGQTILRPKEQVNEACNEEKPMAIESQDIMSKRWVYPSSSLTIFYLGDDHTCSLKDSRDDYDSQAEQITAKWKLAGDTLIFLFTAYQNNPDADTAFYKITCLTAHKLRMDRIKRPSSSAFWVYPSGTDAYEEQTFLLDEEHETFGKCDIAGKWVYDNHNEYSEPYLYQFNISNSCYATGVNNSAEGYKGTWRLQGNLILMTWNKEYRGKKYSDDGYDALLELDSIDVVKYDTLHVVKSTSYSFDTEEHGTFLKINESRPQAKSPRD